MLDQGAEATTAVGLVEPSATVVPLDPTSAAFAALPLVDGSGHPLYSAIVTASDNSCGGCDNDATGEAAINARAADIATYFNDGGGILALAGASSSIYYNFVPVSATPVATSGPYAPTALGTSLGVTTDEANCCLTHNSFVTPPAGSALQILETDTGNGGIPETLIALNATISGGGIGSGGGGGGVGAATPELGSGELLATGLVPALAILVYRRRRTVRQAMQSRETPAA